MDDPIEKEHKRSGDAHREPSAFARARWIPGALSQCESADERRGRVRLRVRKWHPAQQHFGQHHALRSQRRSRRRSFLQRRLPESERRLDGSHQSRLRQQRRRELENLNQALRSRRPRHPRRHQLGRGDAVDELNLQDHDRTVRRRKRVH